MGNFCFPCLKCIFRVSLEKNVGFCRRHFPIPEYSRPAGELHDPRLELRADSEQTFGHFRQIEMSTLDPACRTHDRSLRPRGQAQWDFTLNEATCRRPAKLADTKGEELL